MSPLPPARRHLKKDACWHGKTWNSSHGLGQYDPVVHGQGPVKRRLPAPLVLVYGGVNGDIATLEARRRPVERRALLEADRVVCISPQIAHELARYGVDAAKVWPIPNGVDLERFRNVTPARDLPGPPDAERVL